MKRWQRMVLAQTVALVLTCALVGIVVAALVFTVEESDDTRYFGVVALAIVLLGATQIAVLRDRIRGR